MHQSIALVNQVRDLQQTILKFARILGFYFVASTAIGTEKPNIVFILSDAHCLSPHIRFPNQDGNATKRPVRYR
ncbi:hypothetical protein SH528x_007378 [Novipirellula sp. SH528]|uniref:hypothetical protein n=1 Tax=Novipirellula sp. SH528 TaxID=3454466 RepID=UPI003FA13C72